MSGYLTHLKAMNVEALKGTFDDLYPEERWRGVHVSIEYPVDKMAYPGIWVDYSDVDKLRTAGVDHKEIRDDGGLLINPVKRWKFSGYVSFTVTALTSLERDLLYDELVKVLAFGQMDPLRKRYRQAIEENDFIASNMDFDEIEPQGNSAAPGTPWGTDEIIYERTLNMEIIGEFVSDSATGELVLLSEIVFIPEVVATDEDYVASGGTQGDLPTQWH